MVMAMKEFDEPPHYGGVEHTERVVDLVVTSKDLGKSLRIGLYDFFCISGLDEEIALARWLDDDKKFIGAYVGREIGLESRRNPETGEALQDGGFLQPCGYLWLHADKLPENLAQRYWHFNAELKKNMQR